MKAAAFLLALAGIVGGLAAMLFGTDTETVSTGTMVAIYSAGMLGVCFLLAKG